MKKHSLMYFLVFTLCFIAESGWSQQGLVNHEYGSVIQDWLDLNKSKYQLNNNDISYLLVSDTYKSAKTRIHHVYVNQAYQGVKIHNAISSIAIRDNAVFYYANGFISDIGSKVNSTDPAIDAQSAISIVASAFNLGSSTNISLLEADGNSYLFSNGEISKVDIPVQLMYQFTEDASLRLAWDLSVYAIDGSSWHSVRVDALNGDILEVNDWILTCNFGDHNISTHSETSDRGHKTYFSSENPQPSIMVDGSQYNVFPIPIESPNHGPIQLISEPAELTASPFGWHDTDGLVGAEFTITRGNNVWAQEDADGNNGTGFSPDGGAILSFNYPYSGNQEPIGFQNASITNLFYMNNIMHDIWYQYGFDEVSGNFQANNYGNGGAANDFVLADAQDGSGLNNATFGTPADGASPGMTMFLWSAPLGQPLNINTGGPIVGPITGSLPATGAGNNIPGPFPTPVTADLALVIDDNSVDDTTAPGYIADVNDGCGVLTNAASLSGKIAVIRRGNCTFVQKIQNAQDAGAVGVIMVNHNNPAGDPGYTTYVNMSGTTTPAFTIPSVFISNADGEQLITALLNSTVINATLQEPQVFQKDGSLDNGIVAHEYGHGISSRLAGGPSATNCLNNAEQMGEGWSDWFALMLTMTASDLPETPRGIATYSVSQPVTGLGIRPFPYSIDTTINPLTYDDTNDTVNISQPHGIGTIWATILWDLTWKYIDKYGFDPDIYHGTGGNNKIMQLVLDGLKLQSCNAGFVFGRDGILAADIALSGGADQCMIWEVFAARGVGLNAFQGTGQSRTNQVEDFTLPPATDPTLANCTALSVDEFVLADTLSIYPNPTTHSIHLKTKKNLGMVHLSLTDLNGRMVLSKKIKLSDQVVLDISSLQTGMYILNIKGDSFLGHIKIIKN